MGKWKRGLSGFLAVVPSLSAMQGDILYASAADLVEKLTAEISDGDVNGDGKTNSADVQLEASLHPERDNMTSITMETLMCGIYWRYSNW